MTYLVPVKEFKFKLPSYTTFQYQNLECSVGKCMPVLNGS